MKIVAKLLGLMFLTYLNCSCSSNKNLGNIDSLPCYDGWANEGTIISVVWQPTHEFWEELVSQIEGSRKFGCWFKTSDGRYLITSINKDGKSILSAFGLNQSNYVLIAEQEIFNGQYKSPNKQSQ